MTRYRCGLCDEKYQTDSAKAFQSHQNSCAPKRSRVMPPKSARRKSLDDLDRTPPHYSTWTKGRHPSR